VTVAGGLLLYVIGGKDDETSESRKQRLSLVHPEPLSSPATRLGSTAAPSLNEVRK
jgi:hypothetical protein